MNVLTEAHEEERDVEEEDIDKEEALDRAMTFDGGVERGEEVGDTPEREDDSHEEGRDTSLLSDEGKESVGGSTNEEVIRDSSEDGEGDPAGAV